MSQTAIDITILVIGPAGLAALMVWLVLKRRATPEKRERRRRLLLHQQGRLGEALITEIGDDHLYYSYSIRGVQYTASQDVGALRGRLPQDLSRVIGTAGMKYATNNPGNSILICEEWSGLRQPAGAASDPAA